MKPLDLIETANSLLYQTKGKPTEANLRRAVSTAYYALFHGLARDCADLLIGGMGAQRSRPAWAQTYRALEHGFARAQCENQQIVGKFPRDIQLFANAFVAIQKKRHIADYDPTAKFSKSVVASDIALAAGAMAALRGVPAADRRAFCAWVLFRTPRK